MAGFRAPKVALATLLLAAGCATGKAAGPVDPFALPEVSEKSPTTIEYQIASAGANRLGTLYRAEFDLSGVRRMRRVGDRITRYSERPTLTYQYEVLDTKQLQAMSLPDGTVLMTRGLLQLLDTDDEVAAMLAHEVAHVTHRHALKTYERTVSGGRVFGSVVASLATTLVGMPALGVHLVQGAGERGYAPKQEEQADVTALRYLRRAGYNPDVYPAVLKKMVRHVYHHPETMPASISKWKTHPDIVKRLRFIEVALERVKREEPVLYQPQSSPP